MDLEKSMELLSELGNKLRATITDDLIRKAMVPPNIVEEEASIANSINLLGGGSHMNALGDPVDSNPDRIIPLTDRKTSDQIHCHHYPSISRNLIRHEWAGRRSWEDLGPVAEVATHDILGDIARDPWPPVVAGYEL